MNEHPQPNPDSSQESDDYGAETGSSVPRSHQVPPDPYGNNPEANPAQPHPYGTHPSPNQVPPGPGNPHPGANPMPPNAYGSTPGVNSAPPNPYGHNPGQTPPVSPPYTQGFYPPHPSHQTGSGANPAAVKGKTAFSDTASVLKRLTKDPITGLPTALTALGDSRALNVGILLACAFVLTFWWSIWRVSSAFLGFLSFARSGFFLGTDFTPELGITDHLKIILFSSLPLLILLGILVATQRIFKGQVNIKQMVFITAISVCPFTILQLLITIFGAGNPELLGILLVVTFTTFILTVHTSLIYVLRLTARASFIMVPVTLLATFYILKLLLETLLST